MKRRNSSQPPARALRASGPTARALAPWVGAVLAAHLLLALGPATGRWLAAARAEPPRKPPALRIAWVEAPAPRPAPPSAAEAPSLTSPPSTSTSATRDLPGLRLPPSRTLAYTVQGRSRGQSLAGDAELTWHHDGQHYQASLWQQTEAGRRVMHSSGDVGARGLAPARFGDRSEGRDDAQGAAGRRSEQALHFDAALDASGAPARRVRFSSNLPETRLPEDAQDRLSVLLQLAAQVAGLGRPLRPGDRLAFAVATTRWAGRWEFRFEAEERLSLAPGSAGEPRAPLTVLRLHRAPGGPHDLDIQVWLAPALDYLPVRWRLAQDNGDWLEQHWTGADPSPRPSSPP